MNWTITSNVYNPATHNHLAPVNTVGNGFVCCRGFMEEQQEGIAGLGGIYMAGLFGRASYIPWKGEGQELVNIPNFLWVYITVNGSPLQIAPETLSNYTETLDMHRGEFIRRYTYAQDGEAIAAFTFSRFVSRNNLHLAGQRITVTPLKDDTDICLHLGINASVTNLNEVSSEPYPIQPGKKHFHTTYRDASTLCVSLANNEETELAFAQKITAQGIDLSNTNDCVTVRVQNPKGHTANIEKLIVMSDPGRQGAPLSYVRDRIADIPDYAEVFADHMTAMQAFWENADIRIDGDDKALQSLRYNIFQLEQSCPRHTGLLSIGARGLTGEMYEGSVFWDTEIFMLPFFTMTDPDAARNLLMFRYNTLPASKEHAASNWFEGAMYGWQVNAAGVEQTPQGVGAYYSVHVVADIAFAILEYWNATGDERFMTDYGLEILIETARFWASRVTVREDGLYDIMAVRGPNEYDVLVNNNLYTNMMARENFLLCEYILQLFSDKLPQGLAPEPDEIEQWREIAKNIVLPYDAKHELWLEDDTWYRRKPLDMAKAKPTAKRIIDTTIPYEALPFYQITKQADVLHVMKNLPWHFTQRQIEIAFDYYKPKTAFDSSLAYSMFALMAARLGRKDEAASYFDTCINLDIKNVQLNTISGLHFANFGGAWQAAVFGFGGVAVMKDQLRIQPNLPAHWERMLFRLWYRGSLLEVELRQNTAGVRLLEQGGKIVRLSVYGETFTLTDAGLHVTRSQDERKADGYETV